PAHVFPARDAAQLAHDVLGRAALLGQLAKGLEGFAIGEHVPERSGGRLLLLRCLGHGMAPWELRRPDKPRRGQMLTYCPALSEFPGQAMSAKGISSK